MPSNEKNLTNDSDEIINDDALAADIELDETAATYIVGSDIATTTVTTSNDDDTADSDDDDTVGVDDLLEEVIGNHDDFDWSLDKRGSINYEAAARSTMLASYEATMNNIAENEIVKGRITAMSGGDVVLDVNAKSDGLIPGGEFRDMPDLKIGDYVDVYVESQEDVRGQLSLSRRKAKILRAWERIVDSFTNGSVIEGTIKSKTKGGLIADCGGLETFLPGSQIDIKPIADYDQYVGKVMEFKVVKINEHIKNAVVSHKILIENDLAQQRETILQTLDKGQVLEGVVKGITDFGAFLDLGGVDGLLYITDISYGRINHPSQVLTLGQRLNVVVLEFDEAKRRISLGLKQLTPHPWEVLPEGVSEGSVVKGRIVNIEDYGAFVEIVPGVEGLIHISEISWGNQSVNAREFFTLDQEVEARVVTIDQGDRKMSLSIKQLSVDPWSEIGAKFPVGTRIKSTVKNLTNYGVFVELHEGVGGMVHISDLSWTRRYAHPSEFTKVGAEIEVVVLDVDMEKRQISLGHKQIEENPWDTFETIFTDGSYHEATVSKRDDKGAILQMQYGLESFAPSKHIRKEDGSFAEPGETLTVKVIEFSKEDRKIVVSHTRYLEDLKRKADDLVRAESDKEARDMDNTIKEVTSKVERNTLGDLAVLNQLKEQLANNPTPPPPAAE